MAAANGVQSAGSSLSDENDGAHIGDSICTECYGMGNSKIERRSIPGFRDIIVSVFQCEDCGRRAEEVQLAGQFAEQGVRLRLAVPLGCAATLGRQVLKSDTATISIPELEFEIGAGAYVPFAGDLTTVAQVLRQACKNLNMNQEERRAADAETASKIDEFISELEGYAAGRHAFTFEVEDIAGNSYISGPAEGGAAGGGDSDAQLTVEHFARTAAQESRMGLAMPHEFLQEGQEAAGGDEPAAAAASAPGRLILRVEGLQEAAAFVESYAAGAGPIVQSPTAMAAAAGVELPSSCAACGSGTDAGFVVGVHRPVPAFISGCLIVSTACNSCSAAAAEVRSIRGGAASGSRIRLRVEMPADLERAVLQSASASISLPELELALSTGSNAGMVTTVGQLVSNLAQQLGSNAALQPGAGGAEGAEAEQAEWSEFLASLRAFAALERPWTLELTDPLDSSFVAPAAAGGEGDTRLTVVRYERAPDENQHFGLAAGGGAAEVA